MFEPNQGALLTNAASTSYHPRSSSPPPIFFQKDKKKPAAEASKKKKKNSPVAIDDLTFHQCVNLGKFDTKGQITFVPPDGEFELMKYVTEPQSVCNSRLASGTSVWGVSCAAGRNSRRTDGRLPF